MANIKWGLLAGAGAFIISFAVGLISGVNLLYILLRALVFTGIFFGMGFGVHILMEHFLPELMSGKNKASSAAFGENPGSRVNIVLENTNDYAVPELYGNTANSQNLGNIEDLVSGAFKAEQGIDRNKEDGYNNSIGGGYEPEQASSGIPEPEPYMQPEKPAFAPVFGDELGLEGLLDLDLMAMAFSSGSSGAVPVASGGSVHEAESMQSHEAVEHIRSLGNKPQPLKGDFKAKELAEGLRTILNKEK